MSILVKISPGERPTSDNTGHHRKPPQKSRKCKSVAGMEETPRGQHAGCVGVCGVCGGMWGGVGVGRGWPGAMSTRSPPGPATDQILPQNFNY